MTHAPQETRPTPTIDWVDGTIRLIDQTRLPGEFVQVDCSDLETLWEAIRELRVRGAPAIGLAAVLGMLLRVQQLKHEDVDTLLAGLEETEEYLKSARPTAVNLSWGLEQMMVRAREVASDGTQAVCEALEKLAKSLIADDARICREIGKHGAALLEEGAQVLTYCNAGGLATYDFGTALGVILQAQVEGKHPSVYACETRPLLQGARLTSWELLRADIHATLICDNTAATLMQQGRLGHVIVGADRITANGDTANKIGRYNLAVLAHHHNIPLYVAAPLSTFDFSLESGKQIPIEERPAEEVRSIRSVAIAPEGIDVYNPAFDVTPHELIAAFVTEHGVVHPPYMTTLETLRQRASRSAG